MKAEKLRIKKTFFQKFGRWDKPIGFSLPITLYQPKHVQNRQVEHCNTCSIQTPPFIFHGMHITVAAGKCISHHHMGYSSCSWLGTAEGLHQHPTESRLIVRTISCLPMETENILCCLLHFFSCTTYRPCASASSQLIL